MSRSSSDGFSRARIGVTNVYDALGRVTSTTDSNGRVLQSVYDAAGDRTQLTYADGGANGLAVQYGYDNLGRVTTITGIGGHHTRFEVPDHSAPSWSETPKLDL